MYKYMPLIPRVPLPSLWHVLSDTRVEGKGNTGMGHRSAYAPRTRQDWLAIHILIDKYIYIILQYIYIYIYELLV